ncbi:MAG: hypothetical protein AAF618_13655 [Pseudomonadota bacterium]
MTKEEQTLEDAKLRAEVSKILMEVRRLGDEDLERQARITRMAAETERIKQQMRWQIPVYLVTFIGTLVASVIAIINVFGN